MKKFEINHFNLLLKLVDDSIRFAGKDKTDSACRIFLARLAGFLQAKSVDYVPTGILQICIEELMPHLREVTSDTIPAQGREADPQGSISHSG